MSESDSAFVARMTLHRSLWGERHVGNIQIHDYCRLFDLAEAMLVKKRSRQTRKCEGGVGEEGEGGAGVSESDDERLARLWRADLHWLVNHAERCIKAEALVGKLAAALQLFGEMYRPGMSGWGWQIELWRDVGPGHSDIVKLTPEPLKAAKDLLTKPAVKAALAKRADNDSA